MPTKKIAAGRRRGLNFSFFTETIAELKKVVWLSRQEIAYLTGLVLLVSVVMGALLGVIDFGFTKLVNGVFIGG